MIAVSHKIDEEHVVRTLQEAVEKLDSADEEVVVDFSSVRRVDPRALRALEEFVDKADHKSVKAVLRGVNVDVYKVLTLVKLVPRFSFVN